MESIYSVHCRHLHFRSLWHTYISFYSSQLEAITIELMYLFLFLKPYIKQLNIVIVHRERERDGPPDTGVMW